MLRNKTQKKNKPLYSGGFKDGQGVLLYYSSKGVLVKINSYSNGVVEEVNFYKGKTSTVGFYNDIKNESTTTYYSKQKKYSTDYFKGDTLIKRVFYDVGEGIGSIEYFENRIIYKKEFYSDGRLNDTILFID